MTTLVHPADADADEHSLSGLLGGARLQDDGGAARLLAELDPGHAGRITEIRLDPERFLANSPLRVGAHLRVVEVGGRGWRHVRIDFREYSVPPSLAARIVVDTSEEPEIEAGDPSATAESCYQALQSKQSRGIWRVLVIRRDLGTIVRGELFDNADAARAALGALREELTALSPDAFRARHRLP
jgi:hypothetical protein